MLYNLSYGSKVNMTCEVTGHYVMHWYKNGKTLKSTDDISGEGGTFYITRKRLIIKRFIEDDDGLYVCEAQRNHVRWKATDNIYLSAGKGNIGI